MLIGLGHSAQVGKDTCADYLVKKHGYKRIAFADALRDFIYETNSYVRGLVDRHGWENAKLAYPTVRKTLVEVGNAARGIMGEDIWVQAAFRRVTSDRVVVTDVRYPNEVDAVWSWAANAIVVKVTRPGICPLDNVADQALADFDRWDAVVVNDGTVDDLYARLDELLAQGA